MLKTTNSPAQLTHWPCGQGSRRRSSPTTAAFTTVELLVAIGILVVLIGLLFAAGRAVIGGNRANATKVALKNLKGMMGEFEAATKFNKTPPTFLWFDGSNVVDAPRAVANLGPAAYVYNFWTMPYRIYNNANNKPEPLISPGVVDPSSAARQGSLAVINTQLAMQLMSSLPSNAQRLAAMQDDQKMVLEWSGGSVSYPGSDHYTGSNPRGIQYGAGVRVRHQGVDYVGTNAVASPYPTGVAPVPNSTSSATWADKPGGLSAAASIGAGAPLLKDGWGNPIIFVPGTGLRVLLRNESSSYDPNVVTQRFIIVSPEGKVANQGTNDPYVEVVGRPFFASAGPDGNFLTGDDNVYSFEEGV